MNEGSDKSNNVPRTNLTRGFDVPAELGFMLRKISASGTSIAYWLTVPEFVSEMRNKVLHNETIDNESVLPIMERIYDEKLHLRNRGVDVDFGFYRARKAINQLSRIRK